jgi:phosphogluconate dehydratase
MTTPSPIPATLHRVVDEVTRRIVERSRADRQTYLDTMGSLRRDSSYRAGMSCANLAHAWAGMPADDKLVLRQEREPNIGIVTAYNDMLSAHRPYEHFPPRIRAAARALGATAQVAGGVPAMCDGVT